MTACPTTLTQYLTGEDFIWPTSLLRSLTRKKFCDAYYRNKPVSFLILDFIEPSFL